MDYIIRRAGISDLDELVQFTLREAEEAEGRRPNEATARLGIRAALEDVSVAVYWVAAAEPAGIAGNISVVKEWSNWNAGYYWWIQSLYILPEHRGRGIMKLLIDAVQESASKNQALDLRLYVHKNNERALRAYRKAGFVDAAYRIMRIDV
ncbi:MAG: GNAT family N-acetyltransferase [Candidatus Aminicenantes bacterium RBG_13_59_9]|jgi:ribosomal protein S18 acetylase RimI-like enzyme|nr:MAG: GNAT family N-acetyltransferase [Candidatus Aminicenantes bacterium RBG_13_59_9]